MNSPVRRSHSSEMSVAPWACWSPATSGTESCQPGNPEVPATIITFDNEATLGGTVNVADSR